MALMPEDVQKQTFREKYKGYDVDEVDRFLDEVTERLADLIAENEQLAARVLELESRPTGDFPAPITAEPEPAPTHEPEPALPPGMDPDLLQRTLLTAQRAADATIADAQAEAEERVSRAQSEADRITSESERRAQEQADRLRADASQVAQAVEDLRQFRDEYTERVRGVIAEHLGLLERAGELPEVPAGLEDAAANVQRSAGAATSAEEAPWVRS